MDVTCISKGVVLDFMNLMSGETMSKGITYLYLMGTGQMYWKKEIPQNPQRKLNLLKLQAFVVIFFRLYSRYISLYYQVVLVLQRRTIINKLHAMFLWLATSPLVCELNLSFSFHESKLLLFSCSFWSVSVCFTDGPYYFLHSFILLLLFFFVCPWSRSACLAKKNIICEKWIFNKSCSWSLAEFWLTLSHVFWDLSYWWAQIDPFQCSDFLVQNFKF